MPSSVPAPGRTQTSHVVRCPDPSGASEKPKVEVPPPEPLPLKEYAEAMPDYDDPAFDRKVLPLNDQSRLYDGFATLASQVLLAPSSGELPATYS